MNMGTRTLAAILGGEEVSVATVEKVAAFMAQHPVRPELADLLEEEPTAEAV